MEGINPTYVKYVVQGNLLRGIDNFLGLAQSVEQVCKEALDNRFSICFLFQLKSIKEATIKLPMAKKKATKMHKKTLQTVIFISKKTCIL